MMIFQTRENIILGGGLAGLSAAYHSGYPIFESQAHIGGTAASKNEDGFVFDMGIHVLQSKNEYFLDLLKKIGITLNTHSRKGWIYSHNTYFPYPFQVNTSHLPIMSRLQCILGFALARKGGRLPENYADWNAINFGPGFSNTFLNPYAKKFWCIPPSEMTFEWVGNRVPRPKFREVVKGAFKNRKTDMGTHVIFQYPSRNKAGFGAISQALADGLENINYNMQATKIDRENKIIFFNNGDTQVYYDNLISTLPLPVIVSLLPDVPQNVRTAVRALKYNSIASVNIGVNKPALTTKHWIHFPEPHISFFRISFPFNFAEGLVPEGTSSIQAEVAYRGEQPDRSKLIKRVQKDLYELGVIPPGTEVISKEIIFMPYGYVIYDHNRRKSVEIIHEYLKSLNIYPCGRYGAWEYFWSDQAILSGKDVVGQILRSKKHLPN